MNLEAIIEKLDNDQTQDMLGHCVDMLSLMEICNTLKAHLSKVNMVELGEWLVEEGSKA